jgi:hypothetical protein
MIFGSHRFDGWETMNIQPGLELSFGRGKPAGHPRIPLAGGIHGPGKGLKQRLYDVVRFIAVKQFQMEIAARLVGEALEELPGQAESERAGHVLFSLSLIDALVGERIQPAPDQAGPSSEVNHAPCEAFIHWHISLSSEGVSGVKPSPIPANSLLVPQRLDNGLPQGNTAVFHGVVRINGKVPVATKLQIQDRMPGEQRQHVVEEGDAGFDGRLAHAVKVQGNRDAGFFGRAAKLCPSDLHLVGI